jgi:hypothetical protein
MTRDDLEQLDTRALRALAQKRLAASARSLRTRASLLKALLRTLGPEGPASAPLPAVTKPSGRARMTRGTAVGTKPTSAARPVALAAAPAKPVPVRTPVSGPEAASADVPVEEGFFLAPHSPRPVRRGGQKPKGEAGRPLPPPPEARRPPEDDVPHLLARDPTTLFLFWDFRRDLERGAAFGLTAPRVLFRLYDGEALVRTVEAPLGRRSLYLEGLVPGHLYSVEAWLSGSDGNARPTGRRSAAVRLAPAVPSTRLDVHLVRVPPESPLGQGPREGHSAAASTEAVGTHGRLELPASLEWRGGPGPVPGSGRP